MLIRVDAVQLFQRYWWRAFRCSGLLPCTDTAWHRVGCLDKASAAPLFRPGMWPVSNQTDAAMLTIVRLELEAEGSKWVEFGAGCGHNFRTQLRRK